MGPSSLLTEYGRSLTSAMAPSFFLTIYGRILLRLRARVWYIEWHANTAPTATSPLMVETSHKGSAPASRNPPSTPAHSVSSSPTSTTQSPPSPQKPTSQTATSSAQSPPKPNPNSPTTTNSPPLNPLFTSPTPRQTPCLSPSQPDPTPNEVQTSAQLQRRQQREQVGQQTCITNINVYKTDQAQAPATLPYTNYELKHEEPPLWNAEEPHQENNECPACRTHCASRRSLRDDPRYDDLIAALYPDIQKFEDEELAFCEEDETRNKQVFTQGLYVNLIVL